MRGQDRAESAIAARLVEQREAGPAHQHRVPPAILGIRGHDDGPGRVDGRREQGFDHVGADHGLVAERDQDRARPGAERGSSDRQRARQAALGRGIDDTPLGAPLDRGLDRGSVRSQHHGHVADARLGEPVEDVLEDRPAVDGREELPAPEPRAGAGGEHDRSDPVVVHPTHLPTCHRGE